MNDARSLETMAAGLREIQRKLDELESLKASLMLESHVAIASGVEVITPTQAAHTTCDNDPELEDAVETVRLWCMHVSHVLDRYLHPSLGRLFMDDANGRLVTRSRQDFRVTIRWLIRATSQILTDTIEYASRTYGHSVGQPPGSMLLASERPHRSTSSEGVANAHLNVSKSIGNWDVIDPPNTNASVFIIHGHDEAARDELERVVSARYLVRTVVMYAETVPTVTLPEKFERCAKNCNLAIALLTPDDVGGKLGTDVSAARVRQNVLVELGWFWGRCGLHNLLLVSPGKLDLPSDLTGLQVVYYERAVEEALSAIDAFMRYHKIELRQRPSPREKRAFRRRPNLKSIQRTR